MLTKGSKVSCKAAAGQATRATVALAGMSNEDRCP